MTASVSSTTSSSSSSAAAGAVAQGQADAAVASGKGSSSTSFTSMNNLQASNPKLFNAMMQGLATSIINQSKAHNDRLVKLIQEGEDH